MCVPVASRRMITCAPGSLVAPSARPRRRCIRAWWTNTFCRRWVGRPCATSRRASASARGARPWRRGIPRWPRWRGPCSMPPWPTPSGTAHCPRTPWTVPGRCGALAWADWDAEASGVTVRRSLVVGAHGAPVLQQVAKTAAGRRRFVVPAKAADALRRQQAWWLEARAAAGARWQAGDWVFSTRAGVPRTPASSVAPMKRRGPAAGELPCAAPLLREPPDRGGCAPRSGE